MEKKLKIVMGKNFLKNHLLENTNHQVEEILLEVQMIFLRKVQNLQFLLKIN